ncbi:MULTISPECIES: hypothetical protein [unclassified Flavobacterium]|uniref:hypothetical protein n=1 Tax=unclassified Flavobacterium TaxID=196869 RepID=UPI000EAD1DFC|nr:MULTISPECIES: hypothetical protein [unclassified Flavobacterium]
MVCYIIIFTIIIYNTLIKKSGLKSATILLLIALQISVSYSQTASSNDSLNSKNKLENLLKLDEEKSNVHFAENQISRQRALLFDAISKNIQEADLILKTGIDYKGFTSELDYVIRLKKTAIDGIIKNKNDFQTLRNITVTSVMLNELQTRVDIQLEKIKKNDLQLSAIQSKIDSLIVKKALFTLPKDSLTKKLYYQRYSQMNSEVRLLNMRFKNALDSISKLQILGTKFKYALQNDIIETDNIRKNEFRNLLHPDGKIFKPSQNNLSFNESFFYSLTKELIILLFFISNHFNTIILMFLLAIALITYLLFLKNKYKKEGFYDKIRFSKQIFEHPVSCAILISFTLFNFLFLYPPFAFTALIWLISIIALTIVNKEYFPKKEKWVWKIYVIFILLALYDNNILIHSVKEVFLILLLALTSAAFGIYILKKKTEILNPFFRYSLYVSIFIEVASLFFILIDQNYNLGKLLMVNGIVTVLMYYLFTNTYRLIIDIINYSNFLRETNEEKQLNISELEKIKFSPKVNTLFIFA